MSVIHSFICLSIKQTVHLLSLGSAAVGSAQVSREPAVPTVSSQPQRACKLREGVHLESILGRTDSKKQKPWRRCTTWPLCSVILLLQEGWCWSHAVTKLHGL